LARFQVDLGLLCFGSFSKFSSCSCGFGLAQFCDSRNLWVTICLRKRPVTTRRHVVESKRTVSTDLGDEETQHVARFDLLGRNEIKNCARRRLTRLQLPTYRSCSFCKRDREVS